MSLKQDGDYWNESQTSAFDWDEDDGQTKTDNELKLDSLSTTIQSGESVNIIYESSAEALVPLDVLISKENLNTILRECSTTHLRAPESATDAVKQISFGRLYSLENFRSLAQKTELLDAALNISDGNAILMVVLYLVKTLKLSLVYKLLSTRPDAISHYAYYLESRMRTNELIDLLTLTVSNNQMMRIYQMIVSNTSNKDQLLKKLENFQVNHPNAFEDTQDHKFLNQHIKFLRWQKDNKIDSLTVDDSVMTAVAKMCDQNWDKSDNTNPNFLCKEQEVSQKQFEWVLLNARAFSGNWKDITTFFLKPNWLNKKVIKTSWSVERIVLRLHKHSAPVEVLEEFLNLMEDSDLSLSLGKKLECHKFVINKLIAQRDRLGLVSHMGNLSNKSDEFYIANTALNTLGKKWKN